MNLQNTLSVCLLSFFCATMVVLISRAFDAQTAQRLEPQLARIADQLESLNASGAFRRTSDISAESSQKPDRLVVNYFYSNTRCPTCRAIESQTYEVVQTRFASLLQDGTVGWKTVNYEDLQNTALTKKFEIVMPVVVLTRFDGGEMVQWKRLDEVWAIVNDKSAFGDFIQQQISTMLGKMQPESSTADSQARPSNLTTLSDAEEFQANNLPLPE